MDTGTKERVMVAEKKVAPLRAERPNQHQQHFESTTTCAFCGDDRNIYQMGDKWICSGCLAALVSMTANDVWPDMVRYTREFETAVLM